MERVNPLDWFMVLLVLLGSGCLLAAGIFKLNLVRIITMNTEWLGNLFYIAVGIAGHYIVWMTYRLNKAE